MIVPVPQSLSSLNSFVLTSPTRLKSFQYPQPLNKLSIKHLILLTPPLVINTKPSSLKGTTIHSVIGKKTKSK